MGWNWIDIQALPSLRPGRTLVLFGAGNGSRELLAHLAETRPGVTPVAVLDNDSTMHGRTFEGLPIHPPSDLPELGADLVVVTTVSGREAVTGQLRSMGLTPENDFVCIGTYPRAGCRANLRQLAKEHARSGLVRGRVLHVGPGGFLGLECGLLALFGEAVESMTSVDAYEFNNIYPCVSAEAGSYRALLEETLALAHELGLDRSAVRARWDALFRTDGADTLVDTQRVALRMPHRFSSLPFADASLDLVCSFAVLEHVRSPERAVQEIRRVLAPGGACFQAVTTCDHRSFGAVEGYTPISYRAHSHEQWEDINTDRFYQNRVAPFQWEELFAAGGFTIADYRVGTLYEPPQEELERLHPDFQSWPLERQREVDCVIVAAKP